MRENAYQAKLIRKLEREFPGCVVIKNDPNYIQGIPDLLVLYESTWAMLEIKRSEKDPIQPNQLYYVDLFDDMSYSSFVYPENEERVFVELQHAFGVNRKTRLSESE